MSGLQALADSAQADQQVARHVLVEQMDQAAGARLILIRAGAGFGKTTLMQQYEQRCLAGDKSVAWLTLDASDNDLSRFLARLETALSALDEGSPVGLDRESMYGLLEWLAHRDRPFAILLDEFEVIQSSAVLSFIQQLLTALPANGRLVIASRQTPEIGLGRIRARGQLLEVNPSALRFSLEETTAFYREKRHLKLSDADIATLHRCTEGWIAALYLAALALQGRDDHEAFIASFSGSNLNLAAYLTDDILSHQSEECRQFLLRTSVLARLSAPLCDELNGPGSQAMIEHLLRANLFLFPADNERRWYRYHSLFGSFLQDALERLHPGESQQLHRAAARWYLSDGQVIPAIEHLLSAGDTEAALQPLTEHIDELVAAGRTRLLLRWMEKIPSTILDQHPALGLMFAWAAVLNRRYAEVERILQGLGASEEGKITRFLLLGVTDRVEEALPHGREVLQWLSPESAFRYGVVLNTLGYCLFVIGRHDEARRLLSQAVQRDPIPGNSFFGSVAASMESLLDLTQARLASALIRLAPPLQGSAEPWVRGQAYLDSVRGLLLYETGDLDAARHLLGRCMPYVMDSGASDVLIGTGLALARIAYAKGDRVTWQRHLNELEHAGRDCGSSRTLCSVLLERARVGTLEGRHDSAAQALRQAERHGGWDRPGLLMYGNDVDTPTIGQLRAKIGEQQFSAAVEASRRALDEALDRHHLRRALKVRVLLAMALDGLGRRDEAFFELTRALQIASHEGFVRIFLDEGKRLGDLLQRWALASLATIRGLNIEQAFLTSLLRQAGEMTDGEPLTERELQVLRLSAEGLLISQISGRLFVSDNTVKTHIRNIHLKLGAHSRTEGVAIARARGLID